MNKYPKPCEYQFELLSKTNPALLIEWVGSGELEPHDLTFAAEYLGNCLNALPCLLLLACHASPMVREGAVYGLSRLQDSINLFLKDLSETDVSPGVREAAREQYETM